MLPPLSSKSGGGSFFARDVPSKELAPVQGKGKPGAAARTFTSIIA